MTKDRITIMLSNELFKHIRGIQADKQRKSKKSVSFSWMLSYCITSKKKFHVKKKSAPKVRISITIDRKTHKKMRGIQADKQVKSKRRISFSGVIENYLSS